MTVSYSQLSKDLVDVIQKYDNPVQQNALQQALAAVGRAEAAEAEAIHYAQILQLHAK